MTLAEAKALTYGQTIYHMTQSNSDGSAQRWRVSGKPKTWKRSPERVSVPIMHGLYDHDHLTERELDLLSLTEPT